MYQEPVQNYDEGNYSESVTDALTSFVLNFDEL